MTNSLCAPTFYILYAREVAYFLTATQDLAYTFHRIEFLTDTLKLLLIGVFEAGKGAFHWRLTEAEKPCHEVAVATMLGRVKAMNFNQVS
ncbi:hypothetical protein [Spirosoma sp.]|uniref:hypothetical protein n=1 Tax=Spirosoma sp. TaxID=1899569 RepID=UPI00262F0A42|nr:hypothetical protein [Spirosoma sp.]MCX6212784.1 hypothetical protein [Spirosoma sp.]